MKNYTPGPWFSRREMKAVQSVYGEGYVTSGESDPYANRVAAVRKAADCDLVADAPALVEALAEIVRKIDAGVVPNADEYRELVGRHIDLSVPVWGYRWLPHYRRAILLRNEAAHYHTDKLELWELACSNPDLGIPESVVEKGRADLGAEGA